MLKRSHFFTLKPFKQSESNSKINITGNVVRDNNKLTVDYLLQGDLSNILIASPKDLPLRKHELWQTTCFEFFLGIEDSSQYWEFNLATTGDWNIYSFTDYRQGMEEETAFTSLPFEIKQQSNSLNIHLEIILDSIINSNTNLAIAMSTVIQYSNEEISYWALNHPESIADFHSRDGFIIRC